MTRIIFIHVFAVFVNFSFFRCTLQQDYSEPYHQERFQVMKEALNWMTFRNNEQIANDQDLEPFFEAMMHRYRISRYYRTLIVAFKDGVVPKLTLQMNAACDPVYVMEYRESMNNSVTDGLLKRFIFKSYDERGDSNRQYCDYRQGLVCNTQTQKCECPHGSMMGPISQGSTIQRCLVQENEVCSLIDLDHEPTSKHESLKKNLLVMVFNLEKPLSCKSGTQCRFKSTSESIPKCYDINNGPWSKGSKKISFGNECAIGLYANAGQCEPKDFGVLPGYMCYNFGPRSRTPSAKVGICAHEVGSFGISNSISPWDPMFIGFVSPATTPLRSWKLHDYYKKHLSNVFNSFISYRAMIRTENERCNVARTDKFLDLWKFFHDLEGTPPQGQDYVATEQQLKDKLQEVIELLDKAENFCAVYTFKYFEPVNQRVDIKPALRCVAQPPTDANGNDGTCQETPAANDVTKDFAEKFMNYQKHVDEMTEAERNQENNFRENLLEREESKCDLKIGSATQNGVLLVGACPKGEGCYEDYGDYQQIYYPNCQLKDSNPIFNIKCQDLNENRGLGPCEEVQLKKKAKQELENVAIYSKLVRGDRCQHELENKIRSKIQTGDDFKGNLYIFLVEFQTGKLGIEGKGFCDRTKLLECKDNGQCDCLDETEPRVDPNTGDQSEHCYKTSGDCQASSLEDLFELMTSSEKTIVESHYGKPEDNCLYTKYCLFITKKKVGVCTDVNTGITGGVQKPKPTKPSPGPPGGNGNWNKPPGNGWGEAGVGRSCGAGWSVIGFMIITLVLR